MPTLELDRHTTRYMSALAARRAASARNTSQVSSDTVPELAATPAKQSRARKLSGDGSKPAEAPSEDKSPRRSAKKRKVGSNSTVAPRYFSAEASGATSNGDGTGSASIANGQTRAFSPSHPVGDPYESSDGESSVDLLKNGVEPIISGIPSRDSTPDTAGPSRPRDVRLTTVAASTFRPRDGVNVSNVASEIWRARIGSDEPGILLSLAADEVRSSDVGWPRAHGAQTIYLSGMYCVTPLIGPLDIFSTILRPPEPGQLLKRHRIFAPSSHPIPSIVTASTEMLPDDTAFRQLWDLPRTFALPSATDRRAMFVISELRCGMDGLSSAPGFSNVWSRGGFAGLRGMTLVRIRCDAID